ncbi:ATP-binding protein [Amycolatopsis magusensis]|uniref:Anti-sigma regulatory factor (Ser/Thr protein kinase) n=1 Tax=Amycolatopsis magusensis TaxID=882444 RepID=A0ABS4Q4K4_9PSEU|nr:ATP-binding protein [Amycolatopsis magusensis]MBP2185741.1 anti-sigma regulatory factor (Ser/Thr protein kinase) [Amycolatopsis magusensis]MDI5979687.1 ATP-binding protein [Amycolatopsis magusensis]
MVDKDPGQHALDLAGDPAELGRVRGWARAALDGVPGVDPALLADVVGALDELASNAIRHGAAPRRVLLRHANGALRVEVSDGSPVRAEYRAPSTDGGRGLRMIEAYVDTWGQTEHDGGKTVWAEFALPPS